MTTRRGFLASAVLPATLAGRSLAIPSSRPLIPTIDQSDPLAPLCRALDAATDAVSVAFEQWEALVRARYEGRSRHEMTRDEIESVFGGEVGQHDNDTLSPSRDAFKDAERELISAMHARRIVAIVYDGRLFADLNSAESADEDTFPELMTLRLEFSDEEWAEDSKGGETL